MFRPKDSHNAAMRATAARQLRCSALKNTWDNKPHKVIVAE